MDVEKAPVGGFFYFPLPNRQLFLDRCSGNSVAAPGATLTPTSL